MLVRIEAAHCPAVGVEDEEEDAQRAVAAGAGDDPREAADDQHEPHVQRRRGERLDGVEPEEVRDVEAARAVAPSVRDELHPRIEREEEEDGALEDVGTDGRDGTEPVSVPRRHWSVSSVPRSPEWQSSRTRTRGAGARSSRWQTRENSTASTRRSDRQRVRRNRSTTAS